MGLIMWLFYVWIIICLHYMRIVISNIRPSYRTLHFIIRYYTDIVHSKIFQDEDNHQLFLSDFGNVNNNANAVASSYRSGTLSSTSSYPTTTKGRCFWRLAYDVCLEVRTFWPLKPLRKLQLNKCKIYRK